MSGSFLMIEETSSVATFLKPRFALDFNLR